MSTEVCQLCKQMFRRCRKGDICDNNQVVYVQHDHHICEVRHQSRQGCVTCSEARAKMTLEDIRKHRLGGALYKTS